MMSHSNSVLFLHDGASLNRPPNFNGLLLWTNEVVFRISEQWCLGHHSKWTIDSNNRLWWWTIHSNMILFSHWTKIHKWGNKWKIMDWGNRRGTWEVQGMETDSYTFFVNHSLVPNGYLETKWMKMVRQSKIRW